MFTSGMRMCYPGGADGNCNGQRFVEYTGEVLDYRRTGRLTAEDCATWCNERWDCQFWAFSAEDYFKKCQLLSTKTGERYNKAFTSSSRCKDFVYDTCVKNHEVAFEGEEVTIWYSPDIRFVVDCIKECQEDEQCKFWKYIYEAINNRGCYLLSSKTGSKNSTKAISGPKCVGPQGAMETGGGTGESTSPEGACLKLIDVFLNGIPVNPPRFEPRYQRQDEEEVDADGCKKKCDDNPDCRSWTLGKTWPGARRAECKLLRRAEGKGEQQYGAVSGNKCQKAGTYATCSTTKEDAIMYIGSVLVDVMSPDEDDCAQKCEKNPKCNYWSFVRDYRQCTQLADKIKTELRRGVVSSPKCKLAAAGGGGCTREEGVGYIGGRRVDTKDARDADECSVACSKDARCQFWLFSPGKWMGTCQLTSTRGNRIEGGRVRTDVTAGTKCDLKMMSNYQPTRGYGDGGYGDGGYGDMGMDGRFGRPGGDYGIGGYRG